MIVVKEDKIATFKDAFIKKATDVGFAVKID